MLNRTFVLFIVFMLASVFFTDSIASKFNTKFNEMLDEIMRSVIQNDHKRTLQLLDAVIDDDPNSYDALILRCQTYLQAGNVERAINDINSALLLKQDDSMLLYRCIIKESQAKNEEEAMQCYADTAKNMQGIHSKEYIDRSKEYVMISILGNFYNYEEIRQRYINITKENDDNRINDEPKIRNFSRSTIIPIIKSIRDSQNKANNMNK